MKLYTCSAIQDLMERYINQNGEIVQIEDGCLGYGFMIMFGNDLKTAIV